MVATNQKLKWAHRAVDEMRDAEQRLSVDDFQYHFGAFLALLGALRRFVLEDAGPAVPDVHAMDEENEHYCCCIDLRNVDLHIRNAAGNVRSHFAVDVQEAISFSTESVALKIESTDGSVSNFVTQPTTTNQTGAQQSQPATVTATYYVDPSSFISKFGFRHGSGQPRTIRSRELQLMIDTSALVLAEKALGYFDNTVLTEAKALGVTPP
jgi:hypothetical protein